MAWIEASEYAAAGAKPLAEEPLCLEESIDPLDASGIQLILDLYEPLVEQRFSGE